MTIKNNKVALHSFFHHPSLQRSSEIHESVASTSISYRHRCCSKQSTCRAMSAKLIWVRKWAWVEFISAEWESSSHMLGLLGTWEPYPYFPWGGSRCNPDRSMETLNWAEMEESYLYQLLRAQTHAHRHTRLHTHGWAEVHILNVTYFSLRYLVLW